MAGICDEDGSEQITMNSLRSEGKLKTQRKMEDKLKRYIKKSLQI